MLVMTNYFTKWIEAEAYAQVKDKEVVSFIKRNILTRFGIPSQIICDNGSQFISKRMQCMGNQNDNVHSSTSTGQWTSRIE